MPRYFVQKLMVEIWDGTNVEAMKNVINGGDPNAIVKRNPENGAQLQMFNADESLAHTYNIGDGAMGGGFLSANDIAANYREI